MPLEQLLKRLYDLNRFAEKSGLKNMVQLCVLLKNPEKKFKTVHVGGTNGKGSVTTKTAKGLESKYRKVGLYTSPHISQFHERIRINGIPISDQDLAAVLEEVFALMDKHKVPATFFEVATAAAFRYFEQQQVEFAVIEVGLGGRCDATNVITPEITAITSISLEHTEILGHNIIMIAKEKAGIQKPGVPMVIGPTVPSKSLSGNPIQIKGPFLNYDDENNAIARKLMEHLNIEHHEIEKALTVRPPCRLQIQQIQGIPVIFDVAHNPDGLKRLFQSLTQPFGDHFHVVCGFSKTKAIKDCFTQISPHAERLTLTQSHCERAASIESLVGQIPTTITCSIEPNPYNAVQEAMAYAIKRQNPLVICGTFYIMEAALKAVADYGSK